MASRITPAPRARLLPGLAVLTVLLSGCSVFEAPPS